MIKGKFKKLIIVLSPFCFIWGCDCQRLEKCEWYIVPEEKHAHLVKPGFVSVCLRNYTTNKEKCILDMKLEDAEHVYGKKVTYSSVVLDEKNFPRRILKYSFCKE